MGKHLTAAEILERCQAKEEDFDIGGGVIRIKGLTKAVQQQARQSATKGEEIDTDALEVAIFKAGVIDPVLTDEDVSALKDSMAATTFDAVVLAISRLSGLDETAAKQAKKDSP